MIGEDAYLAGRAAGTRYWLMGLQPVGKPASVNWRSPSTRPHKASAVEKMPDGRFALRAKIGPSKGRDAGAFIEWSSDLPRNGRT